MTERSWLKDLMVPFSEYANVELDATLQQAIRALDRARANIPPGRHLHRSVLVRRKNGTIVGWLGYHSILAAIRPEQKSVVLNGTMRRAGVSEDLMARSQEMLHLLQPDLPSLCERARSISVQSLMLDRPVTISINASFNDAIDHFIEHNVQSLLVVDGDDVTGILRIADLFDEVTRKALGSDDGACADED